MRQQTPSGGAGRTALWSQTGSASVSRPAGSDALLQGPAAQRPRKACLLGAWVRKGQQADGGLGVPQRDGLGT